MATMPRFQLNEDFAEGMHCSICSRQDLAVVHVEDLPDYVLCNHCEAQFIVEDGGDRVLYGEIDLDYPEARRFALRQWAWPEAIANLARTKREVIPDEISDPKTPPFSLEAERRLDPIVDDIPASAGVPLESEPVSSVPVTPVQLDIRNEDEAADLPPPPKPPEEVISLETEEDAEAAMPAVEADIQVAEPSSYIPRSTDPPTMQRFRVVLKGSQVRFPKEFCAHDTRKPVRGKLAVTGALPKGQGVDQRQMTTFKIPLCLQCRKRASQTHEDEKAARLQAHLVSAILGLVMVVATLAFGLVDLQSFQVRDALILVILTILGYSIPAMILLNRVRDFGLPPDAAYVQSTLLMPAETLGLETAFEWRNQEYAELFHEMNKNNALGKVTPIKDRTATP